MLTIDSKLLLTLSTDLSKSFPATGLVRR